MQIDPTLHSTLENYKLLTNLVVPRPIAWVGEADEAQLVKPKAYVVLKQGVAASPGLEESLKQHVKSRLAPYKYPRWIEFVSELPKTATGKIQRFKLRRPALGKSFDS